MTFVHVAWVRPDDAPEGGPTPPPPPGGDDAAPPAPPATAPPRRRRGGARVESAADPAPRHAERRSRR